MAADIGIVSGKSTSILGVSSSGVKIEAKWGTERGHQYKARYAVLFQMRTFPSEPEDEAHIGPTATYDEVIYPGFQHDITTLQIQGCNISYNRHTIHQVKTYAWVQATIRCLVAKVKHTIPMSTRVQA